ncbi:MAG: pyridoxal-phosphate dependent enzyme [Deltaproteobacteria bacterium]|nr:pyridoxal-phosphate dependent enzyme [Deltaproteobacteria bacterium]
MSTPDPIRAEPLALERRFPALAGRLPRLPLAVLPTPAHRLANLGRDVGLADLWVKRDDLTGAPYGGNKVRKLEWLLADARARGHRSVLTTGALGSNHALATAIYARASGFRAHLVLIPQPVTEHVRRALVLDHAYGAAIHAVPSIGAARRRVLGLIALGALAGDRPYLVATGGSSAVGTLGYVNAGLELAEQVAAGTLPEPAAVVVPLGSGGTVAGLVAGLRLGGLATRVLAVRVTDLLPLSPRFLARLAARALAMLARLGAGALPAIAPGDFDIRSEWLGPGYGVVTPEAVDAARRLAATEGLRLETTYGAKALAGALALGQAPAWRGRPLLFWHTYSAADPAATLANLPDWRELPREVHHVFGEGPGALPS